MARPSFDILCEEILSQLERKENQLLEWGFVGGAITAEAVIAPLLDHPPTKVLETLIEQQAIGHGAIPTIIDNLVERKLMFRTQDGRYRTRYAEAIRLLFLLKQRFSEKDWQSGRNLVSHVKPMLAYRKYPKRDQTLNDILLDLQAIEIHPNQLKALSTLLRDGLFQLASFQVRSLRQLLEWTQRPTDQATIIGAGTGSGKTKAFYLPAFSHLAALIQQDSRHWAKVIGIYPRVELLKDQFREAISEIIELKTYFEAAGTRSVTIGCYYGDTPRNAQEVIKSQFRKWKKQGSGYICPSLTCPECGSSMLWAESDINWEIKHGSGEKERLTCEDSDCGYHLSSNQIVLTRERMLRTPPDVLFTSTEMLNRKLTSVDERHLFGVQAIAPPLFVLMDEVHIYEGVSGAHVAYLLRRWRKQMGRKRGTHFVGLSATLSNPKAFFSQLTGLKQELVTYVTPEEEEMFSEGMEYNLIVRGDPFSATSILSTSVQTAMLVGRILDPLFEDVSRGAVGSKLFGFTDKLDVINRWYHIEVDAERYKTLSKYRDHELLSDEYRATLQAQVALGQIWHIPKLIDANSLRQPLTLDITSSQHKGVNESAKLVIATSTLEVGYNDPRVGAVIQHKAPRNLASFLQRKGRAGRTRGMRPWTIVVTSAYGRDRYVYDYPEQLFSPNLNDLSLPLRNTYVQRIQMAFAFMEYITHKLFHFGSRVDVRDLFTESGSQRYPDENYYVLKELRNLIDGQDAEWREYVKDSLQLSEADMTRLLWAPPRSFWLELLPTLFVQLQTQYSLAREDQKEYPLRGYVPRTLFTALDVSELTLKLPNEKMEPMAIVPGMIEFAPGNVSKRFVNAERISEAHWISSDTGVIDVNGEDIKSKRITEVPTDSGLLPIYEPYAVKLTQIPSEVSDRSTGFHDWRTFIETVAETTDLEMILHPNSALAPLIKQISWYMSEENNYVAFTRFSPRVLSELKFKKSDRGTESRTFEFTAQDKPAALGFQRFVDALVIEVQAYDLESLYKNTRWDQVVQESKPTFYAHLVKHDPNIVSQLNSFEIEWLTQIILSSVIATAVSRQNDLKGAIEEFKQHAAAIATRTLEVIFHSTIVATGDQDQDPADESKVFRNLFSLIRDTNLMKSFLLNLTSIGDDIRNHADFPDWVKQTATTTIGAAVYRALGQMLPDVNIEDLIIDIQDNFIYLSEGESGGLGIISKVASVIHHSAGRFEEYVIQSLRSCSRHKVSSSLKAVLPLLQESKFQSLLEEIRQARRVEDQQNLLTRLQTELDRVGIPPKREFIISLASKYLRGQSSAQLDALTKELHDLWHQESHRIGCRISVSEFAVACLKYDYIALQVDQLLDRIEAGEDQQQKQRYLLIESLLLADCHDSCPECLEIYSPFQKFIKPSRILVEQMLRPTHVVVRYGEASWKELTKEALQKGRRVRLIGAYEERMHLQQDMLAIVHSPVETSFEVFFPYIEAVHNHGQEWHYDLRIREVSHV